jgi:hypothetical protein
VFFSFLLNRFGRNITPLTIAATHATAKAAGVRTSVMHSST